MKKLRSFILALILVLLIPVNVYATDYGSYCSNTIEYPTDDVPQFSSYVSLSRCLIWFNGVDSCFYMMTVQPASSSWSFSNVTANNNELYCNASRTTSILYKYDPSDSFMWQQVSTANGGLSLGVISSNKKIKFLYTNRDITFVSGSNFTITNNESSAVDDSWIYANFFDPADGSYVGDENNSSGNGSGSGNSVNVDLSQTNGILSQISSKLDTINSNITAFKSDVATKLTTINSTITANFSNLQIFLTGKYQTLYNVIIYGSEEGEEAIEEQEMQLNELSSDLDDINTSVSGASDFINNAGNDVAAYISTFTEFYNGMAALNGLTAVLSFGLVVIVIKKSIGR